jgi:flagellar hook-length control protein FliK
VDNAIANILDRPAPLRNENARQPVANKPDSDNKTNDVQGKNLDSNAANADKSDDNPNDFEKVLADKMSDETTSSEENPNSKSGNQDPSQDQTTENQTIQALLGAEVPAPVVLSVENMQQIQAPTAEVAVVESATQVVAPQAVTPEAVTAVVAQPQTQTTPEATPQPTSDIAPTTENIPVGTAEKPVEEIPTAQQQQTPKTDVPTTPQPLQQTPVEQVPEKTNSTEMPVINAENAEKPVEIDPLTMQDIKNKNENLTLETIADTTEKPAKQENPIVPGNKFKAASNNSTENATELTDATKSALESGDKNNMEAIFGQKKPDFTNIAEKSSDKTNIVSISQTPAQSQVDVVNLNAAVEKIDVQAAALNPTSQVTNAIPAMIQRGDDQLAIMLDPPELGRVMVRLQQTPEGIVGVLEIEKPRTRDEIAANMPEIIKTLQDSGISVKKVEVVLTETDSEDMLRQDGSQEQFANSDQDDLDQSDGQNASGSGRSSASSDGDGNLNKYGSDSASASSGGLNLFV